MLPLLLLPLLLLPLLPSSLLLPLLLASLLLPLLLASLRPLLLASLRPLLPLPQEGRRIGAVQAQAGQVGGQPHGLRGRCHHRRIELHGIDVCSTKSDSNKRGSEGQHWSMGFNLPLTTYCKK